MYSLFSVIILPCMLNNIMHSKSFVQIIFSPSLDDITLMAGFYLIFIGVNANSNNRGYFVAAFITHSHQILMHCKHKLTSTWEGDESVCIYCDMSHLLWPVWIRYYKNWSLVKVVIKRKIISTSGLTINNQTVVRCPSDLTRFCWLSSRDESLS